MYTSASSQVDLDTKSVVAKLDTLRTIQVMEKWQDRVRSEMKKNGITQDRLTSVLGVETRGAVGHYLSGRREPSAVQMRALADFLDVDVDWLLTGKWPRKKIDILAMVVKQTAKKERRPGDEHLSDEEIYERYQEEELQKQIEEDHKIEVESGALERIIELESQRDEPNPSTGSPIANSPSSKNDDELEFIGHMDAWDSDTPLDEDEVELPLFREVELAAGAGQTQVVENHGAKLRFAKSTLSRARVEQANAACAFVRGNSMDPVMPDGTCVGVNTGDTTIRDGEIYAIDHDGMLRVKYLHRRPGGGIKIVSQNSSEHATEEYSAQAVIDNNIRVIGRVFWWSVLR